MRAYGQRHSETPGSYVTSRKESQHGLPIG
jgi:hypothetical protein